MCPFRGGAGSPSITECGLGRGLLPYQVASSFIQPFGHNRHGPKIGWAWVCSFFWVSWVPIEHKVAIPSGILVHPAVWPQRTLVDSKIGGCAPSGEGELCPHLTQCRKWHLDPCSRLVTIDVGRKFGGSAPFWGGELGLHLTQCGLDQGPPSQVPS